MSSILATALFASYATAQLTTSIWLPGAASADVSFLASVIAQNDDRTTLSINFAGTTASDDEYYSEVPPTVVVGGATYAAYEATATDGFGDENLTVTISLGCERANTNAVPTCTVSTAGLGSAVSAACASAGTNSLASDLDDLCTTEQTLTLSGDSQFYINQFPLTITAGTEKLSAAATATASSAASTRSGSASAAPASSAVSGSGSAASTGSTSARASASAASASVSSQSFAGAAPMQTVVPALAGLGAAAAAFFL